ncbi:hypothetical protein [Zunongwangia profunda]|uniref:hypothetical protein n=1 Tax=Zunongwangia profunda TaxID=398743 RepID=UPI00248E3D13|nr:hypothetical protein [Zunongwangia profunda]|tara:strand:- start:15116 stop:15343 length:228 start_codon:yes stop_codon:yes gene_type:complete
MAISKKQAKILALRWQLENLINLPDLETKDFSPYECEKIFRAMEELKISLENRLIKLGDNPSLMPWNYNYLERQK